VNYFGYASGGTQEEAYHVRLVGMGWGTEDGSVIAQAVFYFRMFGPMGEDGPLLKLCTSMQEVRRARDQCDTILSEYETWQRRN